MFARQNQPDLDTLAELMREGKLVAVIDRCFPLNDIAEAIRCVAQKHARGKVVVTISSPAPDA
jgi:NADPH:quinone reductase-like Zn-dependent oxidoreductase